MSIDVKVEMTSRAFLVDQTVLARLTLENRSGDPLTVADPILNELNPEYLIVRPDGSSVTVTLGNARPKEPWTDPESPPATPAMALGPRGKWSEEIPLDPMIPFKEPGPYKLQVALTFGNERLLTQPVNFEVERTRVTAFAAVPQVPGSTQSRLSTAWVHSGVARTAVVDAVRLGTRWGHSRIGKLYSNVVYEVGPAKIRQVAVPAMHADRGMDFANWVVWIDKGKLEAIRTEAGKPSGAPETVFESNKELLLIEPPVMDASHDLRVFAIERGDSEATLIRFDVARKPLGSIKTAYRLLLRSIPISAGALHFQTLEGKRSAVFWLEQSGPQTNLIMVADHASPSPLNLAQFEGIPLQPGTPLALYRATDGKTIVSWATLKRPSGDAILIHSVSVADGGKILDGGARGEVLLGEGKPPEWAFLAVSRGGAHLLWRSQGGQLYYCPPSRSPSRVVQNFREDPPPALLIAEGQAFIVGVQSDGGLAIVALSAKTLEQMTPGR